MPKRKLKGRGPVRPRTGPGGTRPGLAGKVKTKSKTSSLSRPKSMTGKKFTSKLTSRGFGSGLGKAKTGRSMSPPPALRPPGGGGRSKPPGAFKRKGTVKGSLSGLYSTPKPPAAGGGRKPKPPARRKRRGAY